MDDPQVEIMVTDPTMIWEAPDRQGWLRMLAQHRQGIWLGPAVRERRQQQRVGLRATVALHYKPTPGSDHTAVIKNCAIIDASNGGLSVRTYHKIAPGTPVSLDMALGGKHYAFTGRVAQSSGFMGAIRVGIVLEFVGAEAETSPTPSIN
jgi:hypothetical protein